MGSPTASIEPERETFAENENNNLQQRRPTQAGTFRTRSSQNQQILPTQAGTRAE